MQLAENEVEAPSHLHWGHNAEFLPEHPNMPASLSRIKVYGIWILITAIGVLDHLLELHGYRRADSA